MMAIAVTLHYPRQESSVRVLQISEEEMSAVMLTNKGEHGSRDTANLVTEVEQTRSKCRECDGEVEP